MTQTSKNLLDVFRAKGITDEELPVFLNAHFRSAGHRSETNEVFYPKSNSPVLALNYKHGTLQEVHAKVDLPDGAIDELIEILHRDYIGSVGNGFRQEVLFCRLPVNGTWRYRERFQILPIPSTAPRPPFSYAEHPFLIEYSFPATTNGHTSNERSVHALRRLELLLGCLLSTPFRSDRFRGADGTHRWITRISIGGDSPVQCSYEPLGYYWKDLKSHVQGFSSVDEIAPIKLVPASKYYVDSFPVSSDLTLPDDLTESLDCFFGLEPDRQQRFLQACFWFRQADQAASMSSSFINLVNAVERLMPSGKAEGRCSACNKEIKPGPTKLFKHFMDEFAPISPLKNEMRRQFYKIRSDLAHGYSPPFLADMSLDRSLNPLAMKQMEHLSSARQAVRIAMRNWLQPRGTKICDKPGHGHEYFSTFAFSGEHAVVSGDEVRILHRNKGE
jgi:hypothetical protein